MYKKNPGFTKEQIILRFLVGEAMNIDNALIRIGRHDLYLREVKERVLTAKTMEYMVIRLF